MTEAQMSKAVLLSALEDVADNHGMMWRAHSGYDAQRKWDELKRRGLVEWNPWAGAYLPSPAGRSALKEAQGNE